MRDLLAERDPDRNSQFQRRWVDDPLRLPDFQHLDREIPSQVAEGAGRRAIGRWLDKASGTHGAVAEAPHLATQQATRFTPTLEF